MCRTAVALVLLAAFAGCGGGAKVGLPAAFPADVPRPGRAQLRTVRDLGMKGLNVVYETREEVRPIARELGGRLRAAGWTIVADAEVDGAVFSSWRKQERSVALGISRAGEVTTVGISVVERPYNEWEEAG